MKANEVSTGSGSDRVAFVSTRSDSDGVNAEQTEAGTEFFIKMHLLIRLKISVGVGRGAVYTGASS